MKPLIASPTAYVGRDGKITDQDGNYARACNYVAAHVMTPDEPSEDDDSQTWLQAHAAVAKAKAVCGTCYFKDACATDALARKEEAGVWGGVSESERAVLIAAAEKARRKIRDDARAARRKAEKEAAEARAKAEREAAERAVQPVLEFVA